MCIEEVTSMIGGGGGEVYMMELVALPVNQHPGIGEIGHQLHCYEHLFISTTLNNAHHRPYPPPL